MKIEAGSIFTKWTALGGSVQVGNRTKYECVCACGKVAHVDGYALTSGRTMSCGCFGRKEMAAKNRVKNLRHGGCEGGKSSPEYSAWATMKARCGNPSNKKFPLYGGRGILVCDEWVNSFETFLRDVGKKPSDRHSLDRIDGNLGYFKSNVRWADYHTQNKNRSITRLVEVDGEMLTLMEFCKKHGVKYSTAAKRWRLGKRTHEELAGIKKHAQM